MARYFQQKNSPKIPSVNFGSSDFKYIRKKLTNELSSKQLFESLTFEAFMTKQKVFIDGIGIAIIAEARNGPAPTKLELVKKLNMGYANLENIWQSINIWVSNSAP